ncbi:hypothetical protein G6F57_003230 [Rhizopus arrhizus]|uniref:Coiled-coil domain-containing protein 137 n=1 Tax=Rhizopus oryzae TaxID=64495 RepID=A0A9P6XD78_RHIOR|nr:hypothetical protein G6F23_001894 [Rhizopus arrhizus]KAG1425848.1 hypothetical protein G6F58_001745 [Rhizopus delemar]KAG0762897.1 hypothetical protein G6F24_006437 [Rhizopus arrhizus]KAG0782413.1 hypothetical protein G6F22_009117 [Rhizopus arrhizus]KAG0795924.1 hypothetical protein G6F21_001721 [Rhizopus arrhizus]
MPHKRANARVRKERKQDMDLPVSKEDSNVRDGDTPKGFARLFRFKEMALKRQQEKKQAKMNPNSEKNAKKNITIQPGEKLKDFVQRVEQEYQNDMTTAYKTSKTVSESKKKNREKRKQKKLSKLQKEKELYGGRDFDDLKDKVKFGEVADAPPIFSKIPKARGRGKETLEEKTKQAEGEESKGYESEEDQNMKQLKASHKRKIQNMSAAARIQLDNERERAIAAYRAKKAKKMTEQV